MIQLFVLGTLQVRDEPRGELEALLAQPKALALLIYLTLETQRGFQQRDHIVGLFWPELSQDNARTTLRKTLHRLRQTLGDEVVLSRGSESLAISESAVWCDALAFDNAVKERRLREALDWYRGDLLPGFFLSDGGEFERWLEDQRAYLRGRAVDAAWSLVEEYAANKQLTNASQLARRVARLAPADERMLRRVLTMLARLGDRAGALDLYGQFLQRLWKEFETRPSPETVQLVGLIRSGAEV